MSKSKHHRPETIAELRESGYKVLSVRGELRNNLIARIEGDEELFPGVIGYEDTVIPQIENAILAGQHIILLGERGQAKSRIIRQLVGLLDDVIPVIAGCEVNDSLMTPSVAPAKTRWPPTATGSGSTGFPGTGGMGRSWPRRT